MKPKKPLWLLTSLLFLGSFLLGQVPGQKPMGRERMRENINKLRLLRMTEVLELTEEQTAKIYPAYYRVEKEKRGIILTLNREISDLKSLLAGTDAKEDQIASRVKTIKGLKGDLAQKDQEFEAFLGKSLTENQQAKYLIFSVEFYRNLGEKLDRARVMPRDKREN
jgi:Spy/CpxP family protein refolding chaperone